jgi:hypothetical protein
MATQNRSFGYEHISQPLLPLQQYLRRQLASLGIGLGIVLVSLLGGMTGYHELVGLPWIDAFLNSAMILGGMGPVAEIHSDAGKIFAGLYALYSGIAVLAIAGVIAAPLVHRFLHRMHADPDESR